jgi:hypothetical protein
MCQRGRIGISCKLVVQGIPKEGQDRSPCFNARPLIEHVLVYFLQIPIIGVNHKEEGQWGRKSWRELWGDGMIGLVCAVKYPEDKGKRMLMEWRPSPNHAKWSEKKKDQREEKKPTWVKSGTIDCITSIVDKVGSGWFVRFGGTKLSSGKAEAELPIAWLSNEDSTDWKFCSSWGEPLYCGSILMTISKELCMFCWVGILHKGGRSHVGKTMAEELEVEPL